MYYSKSSAVKPDSQPAKKGEIKMRVAILIVAILGSLLAFGSAACATICAASASGLEGMAAEMESELGGEQGSEELGSAASSAMLTAVGFGLQGILGLVGGIMAFSALGKGGVAKTGGIILLAGVVIAMIMGAVAGGDVVGVIIGIIIMGGELHLLGAILALVAKPKGGPTESDSPEPVAV
jgi:hypothetical protein